MIVSTPTVVFTEREIFVANNAARAGAHITKRAITLLVLEKVASDKNASILDYGAGTFAYHTKTLRQAGYTNVTAHEFGRNFRPETHDPDALTRQYDVVYVCNVLNAQVTPEMMEKTIFQISWLIKRTGFVVCNLAHQPVYSAMKKDEVFFLLTRYFGRVKPYPQENYRGAIWICEESSELDEPVYQYIPRPDPIKDVQTFRSTRRNP